jgi:hypothetical protein
VIHGLAAKYGWSEAQIFSLPWVRAKEYCNEISISSGSDVVRDIPEIEEDVVLQMMMRENYESMRPGK